MSKQPKPTQATETGIQGNRRPATLEVEFAESDLELLIRLKSFDAYNAVEGKPASVKCELTGESFTAFKGQLVYHIASSCDALCGYLHPKTVARGEKFIQDRLRFLAHNKRDSAFWNMLDAVRMEAMAERPVVIGGLDVEGCDD